MRKPAGTTVLGMKQMIENIPTPLVSFTGSCVAGFFIICYELKIIPQNPDKTTFLKIIPRNRITRFQLLALHRYSAFIGVNRSVVVVFILSLSTVMV
jgi:hypothetical protein